MLVATACAASGLVLFGRWQGAQSRGRVHIDQGDPSLNPVERVYLQTYLAARVEQLAQPTGTGADEVVFVVRPGQRADEIAADLEAAGLLSDPALFLNYVRYYGLDGKLEAGTYRLSPELTLPELAATLTRAIAVEIELRFLEGWRLEEMADYLAVTRPAAIDAATFLALARRQTPYDFSRYPFLAGLPAGASLEGYLFPDTYRVPLDADASYLIDRLLRTFDERVDGAMRQRFAARGLSLHEAVTLASIVERETPLTSERPLVAAVFLNRLAQAIPLQADPTVQYAVGYDASTQSWWKAPLFQTDLDRDSPYNTYRTSGLPPGPIANPALSALQAVAQPAAVDYLYFVADCSTPETGDHRFSHTYDEHLAMVTLCRESG